MCMRYLQRASNLHSSCRLIISKDCLWLNPTEKTPDISPDPVIK